MTLCHPGPVWRVHTAHAAMLFRVCTLALALVSVAGSRWSSVVIGGTSNSRAVDGAFVLAPEHSTSTTLRIEPSQLLAALETGPVEVVGAESVTVDAALAAQHTPHPLTITTAGLLSILASVHTAGALVLNASSGISVAAPVGAGLLRIHADQDGDGEGMLSVSQSGSLRADVALLIDASDVDLKGAVESNSSVALTASPENRAIGIGDTARPLHLTGEELQHVATTSLTVRGGSIVVDGITEAQSQSVRGVVTLLAPLFGSQIVFTSRPSVFGALSAQCDGGVRVDQNVSTTSGPLIVDGNVNKAYYYLSKMSVAEESVLEQKATEIRRHEVWNSHSTVLLWVSGALARS